VAAGRAELNQLLPRAASPHASNWRRHHRSRSPRKSPPRQTSERYSL